MLGNAHIFWNKDSIGKSFYNIVDPSGDTLFTQQIIPTARRYNEIEVDQDDNVHMLYAVYTDTVTTDETHRMVYQRISTGEELSIEPRTISDLGWEGAYNNVIRPSLAVDFNNNAFASFFTFGELPMELYLEKLDQNGASVVDNLLIFPEYHEDGGGNRTNIALDADDNLHMVTYTDFRNGLGNANTAYGIFNNDAEVIQPIRMMIYGDTVLNTNILMDFKRMPF